MAILANIALGDDEPVDRDTEWPDAETQAYLDDLGLMREAEDAQAEREIERQRLEDAEAV